MAEKKKIEIARMRSGARHTVNVLLKFEENGKPTTEQIAVVYRGVSLDEADQMQTDLEGAGDAAARQATMIKQLVETVIEFPDVVENGAPVQPTAEFFQTLDVYFLTRINQAIIDDRSGKA